MMLQRMQLSIDPYYGRAVDGYEASSSASSSPSFSLSPLLDMSSNTTRTLFSPSSEWRLCFVLCLYEFTSDDPDHLPFQKGEILEIVKKEDSGWWAALRREKIGWIPSAFVTQITDEFAGSLRHIREDLRVYHYEAERKYNSISAPVSALSRSVDDTLHPAYIRQAHMQDDEWVPLTDAGGKVPFVHYVSPSGLVANGFLDDSLHPLCDSIPHSPPQQPSLLDGYSTSESESELESVPDLGDNSMDHGQEPVICPSSPATPMPHPHMPKIEPLHINKPTPPTPGSTSSSSSTDRSSILFRSRSDSAPTTPASVRRTRRQPILLGDHLSLSSLSDFMETKRRTGVVRINTTLPHKRSESDLDLSDNDFKRSPATRRADKVRQLLGDDDAQAFHNAKQAQANLPWYLQPSYTADEIKLEYDGSVRAGTLSSLVERLTVDPLTLKQDNLYRNAFLTTYHTFTTPSEFFDLLVEQYQIDHPPGLSDDEFYEWKERKLRPVQKRVLAIMTIWLEEYDLLQDGPGLGLRLREFLQLIQSPPNLALTAKLILQSLERLSNSLTRARSVSPTATPSKRRKISRGGKNDLIRIDPTDLAEQLALFEYRLYIKVQPKDCILWSKTQTGEAGANLIEFCSTHDRIAGWVKSSILQNEGLGKRADTVDFWIRVAEKCRSLNNFASMTAIVAALTSAMISRLHLTWAHVGRGTQLQPLARLNEPASNFSAYRALHQVTQPPCVPFIAVFLTDIVHIQDQMRDTVSFPLSSASTPLTATAVSTPTVSTTSERTEDLVNFVKRLKWYDSVESIVRFQKKGYEIVENTSMMSFITDQLSLSGARDETVLWTRSAELQQNEMAHADIRKGLEAAGF